MGQKQMSDPRFLGHLRSILRRGMVLHDVTHDPGCVVAAYFLSQTLENANHSGLQRLLHQQVGTPGLVKQRLTGDGISADHHGPALIIKTITHCRLYRGMIDLKGGYPYTICLDDDRFIFPRRKMKSLSATPWMIPVS